MKQSQWRKIFGFAAPYLKRQWRFFLFTVAILIAGGIAASFTPYIWGKMLDCIAQGRVQALLGGIAAYFAITYAALALGIAEGYLGSKVNYAVEAEIKQTLMNQALRMSCADLDKFDAGTLMSRVTSDSGAVISFVFSVITSIVTIVINIAAALIFAFRISTQLSLLSLAFVPLSVIANFVFKKAFRELGLLQKKYGDRLSAFLVDTLSHIPGIKAYCLENKRTGQYEDLIQEGWRLEKKSIFLSNKMTVVSSVIASASTIAVLITSTVLIAQKVFTLGSMVSFQRYIDQLTSAVSSLLQMNYSAQTAGIAVDRMTEMLEMQGEPADESAAAMDIRQIALRDVSFAYREEEPVLDGVALTINQPGVYGLVGENGSGKSTILKLLVRYYRPTGGEIFLNGISQEIIPSNALRKSMGYYAKEVYLQSGTLLENLLLGSRYAEDKEAPEILEQVCRQAGLTEFLDSLPEGLLTDVGENGKLLSSGQKQKIAVVRALLDDSPVLLLDEITSDLDGDAEGKIMGALTELAQRKIILLVTHRTLPLQMAKHIWVLDSGRLAAEGDHQTLLRTSPVYRGLFEKQAGERAAAQIG